MFKKRFRSLVGRLNKLNVVQFGLRGLLLPFRVKHLHGAPRTMAVLTTSLPSVLCEMVKPGLSHSSLIIVP